MKLLDPITIALPAKPQWASFAGDAAREYASRIGFSTSEARRICLATEEAAANALAFGFGMEGEELHLTLARTPVGMRMALRSKGLPLDETSLPQFDPVRLRAEGDTTGLGSFLIRSMVDSATFSILDGQEREIALLKHFPVQDGVQGDEEDTPRSAHAHGLGGRRIATTHSLRLATPEDADGISRLALRAHGGVLFSEQIYYPARVREMIEGGEMVSVVAVAATGELMGHLALAIAEPGAKTEEMTFAVVDGHFKSPSCSHDLVAFLLDNAARRETSAIIVYAVTNHLHSQRGLATAGMRECALFVAASPASRAWGKGGDEGLGRIGNLGMVQRLAQPADTPLFPPSGHGAIIERIAAHIGRPSSFSRATTATAPEADSRIKTFSDFREGWTSITVLQHGRDVLSQIDSHLRLAVAQGVPVVHLQLPLDDPATPAVSEEAERMGFFFAGLMPGLDSRENLVLQFVNGVDPGYDAIQVLTDFGRELKDYVRSCDPGTH